MLNAIGTVSEEKEVVYTAVGDGRTYGVGFHHQGIIEGFELVYTSSFSFVVH